MSKGGRDQLKWNVLIADFGSACHVEKGQLMFEANKGVFEGGSHDSAWTSRHASFHGS